MWRRRKNPRCTAAGRAAVHASRSEIDDGNDRVADFADIRCTVTNGSFLCFPAGPVFNRM